MGLVLYSDKEQYLDVVDVSDPDLLQTEASQLRNNDPILLTRGLPDAVGTLVHRLLEAVRVGKRPIGSLTIHGHGLPGAQSLAGGIPRRARSFEEALATIRPHARDVLANANLECIRPTLSRLRGHFSSEGHVRLMGCYVGQGTEGRRLLRSLAGIWQVPITAGMQIQFAGDLATYFIEGPTITEYP
jgi:hypothetical protein